MRICLGCHVILYPGSLLRRFRRTLDVYPAKAVFVPRPGVQRNDVRSNLVGLLAAGLRLQRGENSLDDFSSIAIESVSRSLYAQGTS